MLLRFMPSELVVPAALALIGSSIPEVIAIVAIAVVGTTVGQFCLFCLVRRAGREYVLQSAGFPSPSRDSSDSTAGSIAGAAWPFP